MRSPTSAREIAAGEALAAAGTFLLAQQDDDGLWRDYLLQPGPSEAWTTAYVGHALLRAPCAIDSRLEAIRRAAAALLELRGPSGWGYNRRTAPDADSTSWVVRFLTTSGIALPVTADDLLRPFLGSSGSARTFQSVARFGSWAAEHDEVTPIVGLALLATGADPALVAQVRCAVLQTHDRASCWRPFWWSTPAYAAAANLELLAASGGIPASVAHCERTHLRRHAPSGSALEGSQRLAASCHLQSGDDADRFLDELLALRLQDGSWPPSRLLRVPDQRTPGSHTLHADDRRLFGTAGALAAIKLWAARCSTRGDGLHFQ